MSVATWELREAQQRGEQTGTTISNSSYSLINTGGTNEK